MALASFLIWATVPHLSKMPLRSLPKWLLLLSLILLSHSCSSFSGPRPFVAATVQGPHAFTTARSGQNQKIATAWLHQFRDPRMTDLVKEALTHNQSLKAAAHRLRAVQQGTIIGRAARLPNLRASTNYSETDGSNIPSSENYSISFNASWEVDLWGRLRNLDLASQADYAASVADFRAARLSLAANTAQAWCNLITAEQQLVLAQKTLDSFEQALPVVERRYRANTLRAVDVQFARNNVASAERNLRSRQLDRGNAARNLEIFLGRYPSASVTSSLKLPHLAEKIPVGLPSQLIERRPDLVAARAQLFASAQNVEAARKSILPSLQLTTNASNSADTLRRVLDPNFLIYSIAASLSQSVYQGGTLNARTQAALDQNRAIIQDYATTALFAFREVEAALAEDHSLAQQQIFLEKEAKQTKLAEKRALSDITLGIDGASFLEYLEAQRRSENASILLIQLKNQRLQNRIDLHLALGGDYFTK